MAEVLATMVVGPLVSMVKDKASSYLLDQYKVMEGMEEQHKLLKRKLPAVLEVINDAEEQAAKNREGAKAWLEELRRVAYKANDVLDEFKYEALRRKAKKEGHYKELGMDLIKLFPSHNRFVFRCRMANKLRVILQEIGVLITEMNTFRFKFKPQPPMSLKWRQTDPNIPDHSEKIASQSRAEEKKKIVGALLGQGDNVGLTVLPIVGMGGMGKTTLAQLVYHDTDIQKHFQLRLWVCVSDNFDVDCLVERIVEAAKANGCQMNGNSALDKLQSAVSGKRYLLVLDDVWNREAYKWENLRSHLHHGAPGSSVVSTTRDKNIAQFMGTIETHEIKDLDASFIEDIIKTGAISSQPRRPNNDELQKMVGDVAKRCSGSPLAATALGSVLRTKNTVQEWEAVLSRNTICDEENGILPVLKLSYNCLPPHMRQCFAFCAMFPKDHEIDVEMLIRLWMANCFIPEQQGVCHEVTGKQIFNELAQRSFFQEVKQFKQVKYYTNMHFQGPRYYSRITCKIHDLMHDVAQDSMGKECATVDREQSQSEDYLYSTRHLFMSVAIPEKVLNASPEKGSPTIQTLICYRGFGIEGLEHLSEYRSVRALKLKTQQGSFLKPKYLHHLRYLDLSGSGINALPEDITLLYHLQTLDLSECYGLERLPKAMKYLTALRHLYTHGCSNLESMPPDLGHLTSLRTLTCFVAGATGSGCSNMGELEKLDLGGQLEVTQLENVRGNDANAAKLWDKKKLEGLTLTWTGGDDKEAHEEVLEGLRPHVGLKAMRMYYYGGSAVPTWMPKLKGMVKLELRGCQNLEKLPALWQLPALRLLYLKELQNLHCLFSGGAPSKFQKLKRMDLIEMPKFEKWWDTNEDVLGEEPLFPEVENLTIRDCGRLTALPKAAVIKQSPSGRDDSERRSAFPALRGMTLFSLNKFHRWGEAGEGVASSVTTFPQLEELEIWDCSELTAFPEAPKLSKLELAGCSQQASLQAASRYVTSLSSLEVQGEGNSMDLVDVVVLEECNHESPLEVLKFRHCSFFFSHSSALALWTWFRKLARLEISHCHALVYWPEKEFRGLVSLRTLEIHQCGKLTGHTTKEAASEQPVLVGGVQQQITGFLPRLESLVINYCEALVRVPNLPASLKNLHIKDCKSLESIVFGQQEEETSGERVVQPADMTAGSSSGATKLVSSSANLLESLEILFCNGLSEVANLPPSIKTLKIDVCHRLGSISGEVPSLEELVILGCSSLQSLPNGPQAYSSLRVLKIKHYSGINLLLPPSLQQRLHHLDEKELDSHLEVIETPEQVEVETSTEHQGSADPVPPPQNAALMSKLVPFGLRSRMACFRSKSED